MEYSNEDDDWQNKIDDWQKKRWKKDNVAKILQNDGFVFKPDGRSGMIYFTESVKLCEIYVEISGVRDYDMLVYFDHLDWTLPEKKRLTKEEEKVLKGKLEIWLNENKIRTDLNASH